MQEIQRDKYKKELLSDKSVKSLTRNLLVVPKPRRCYVLRLAHDKMGHTGYKKVVKLLRKVYMAFVGE